ncbi:MAG: phosphatidate cytidylyltransferase [Bacillota bacterium]
MLKYRVLSAVIAIPILILIFKLGGFLFLALNLIVVTLGINEYFKLVEHKGVRVNKFLGIILGLILIIITYQFANAQYLYGALILGLIIILLKQILVKRNKSAIFSTALTYFGVCYVAGLFSHLILLYNLDIANHSGKLIVIIPILATWFTDTGAYFIGLNLGKKALAPKISPKKTIEGAVGGLLSSIFVTVLLALYFNIALYHGMLLGVLIGVVAQLGDLSASAFKRDSEIKDSGDIIPGHGGILDRIDSLLFVLPVVYYYLLWVIK